MNDNKPEPVPRDFVFAGMRILQGDKIGYEIFVVADDGSLEEGMLFGEKKLKSHIIGGVYGGAEFNDTTARGLGLSRFKARYRGEDAAEREIGWKARNDAAVAEQRHKALVAKHKEMNAIDQAMLPARQAYQNARARGDYILARAIEQSVMDSLRKPVKAHETD